MRTFPISVLPVLFTRYIFLVKNPKTSIRIDHIENGSPPQYSILGSLAIILIIFFSISSMVFLIDLCLWNFLHHFINPFSLKLCNHFLILLLPRLLGVYLTLGIVYPASFSSTILAHYPASASLDHHQMMKWVLHIFGRHFDLFTLTTIYNSNPDMLFHHIKQC